MKRLLPALLLVAALPTHAEIYKWVDESGHTHFGEIVPDKYKKSAKTMNPKPLNTIEGSKLRTTTGAPGGGKAGDTGGPAAPPPSSNPATSPPPATH
ncbi:MAG TPA: DUF4124 domain-containing protein [Moraxellaceae bacterium]|nr:DUF4124 domain-containing protein [Moraxellaceae bacterium]